MKVLYVDTPFFNDISTGARKRSSFLYSTLKKTKELDCLWVTKSLSVDVSELKHDGLVFQIQSVENTKYSVPSNINAFSFEQLNNFRDIVANGNYDSVFFRFYINEPLVKVLTDEFPEVNIVMDVDLLFSELNRKTFMNSISINKRYFLFEYLKLKSFENKLFKKKITFLFSNEHEMGLVSPKSCYVIDNALELNECLLDHKKNNSVLFYGNLSSTVTRDAFDNFIKKIYPHIFEYLLEHNVKLEIVGIGDVSYYKKIIKDLPQTQIFSLVVAGRVDDVMSKIRESRCVILPIYSFSGTLTRIFECVSLKVPIVSTDKAIQGMGLDHFISSSDSPNEFADLLIRTLKYQKQSNNRAKECYCHAKKRYSYAGIQSHLLHALHEIMSVQTIHEMPANVHRVTI